MTILWLAKRHSRMSFSPKSDHDWRSIQRVCWADCTALTNHWGAWWRIKIKRVHFFQKKWFRWFVKSRVTPGKSTFEMECAFSSRPNRRAPIPIWFCIVFAATTFRRLKTAGHFWMFHWGERRISLNLPTSWSFRIISSESYSIKMAQEQFCFSNTWNTSLK